MRQFNLKAVILFTIVCSAIAYDTTIMATCTTCPAGCSVCSGSVCSSCKNGYYLSGSNCTAYPCSVSGCSLCNSQGTCLSCTDPYSVYSSLTNSCVQSCSLSYCTKCKAGSLTCEECQSGYSIYSWDGSCHLQNVQRCLTVHDWRNQQWQCQICEASYKPTPDRLECIASSCPTIPNCIVCTNISVCDSCRAGYSVVNSLCSINPCSVSHCFYCQPGANDTCLKCEYGYTQSGSTCVEDACDLENCLKCKKGSAFCSICRSPYVYNAWSHACEAVSTSPQPENCLTMARRGRYFTCLECLAGYTFQNTNQVKCIKQCPSNCQVCTDSSTCTTCKSGYYLSGSNCSAYTCSISGCALCDSTGQCLSCTDLYSVYSSTQGICSTGCGLLHCQTCLAGSTECLQCQEGYALYSWNNSCSYSLIPRCTQLHDWKGYDFYCSRCESGYKPSLDQLSCIQQLCPSIANCEYCPNSTICSTCSPGYSISGSACQLNPCSVSNCLLCNKGGECIKSKSTYYMVGTSMQAIPCNIPGCVTCKLGSSFCQACAEGYTMNTWTNQCQGQGPSSEGSNLKYLWFLSIVVVIVAVVIIVKCLKKNKGEEQEGNEVKNDPSYNEIEHKEGFKESDFFGTGMSALEINMSMKKPAQKHHEKLPPLIKPKDSKESVAQLDTPFSASPQNIQKQEAIDDNIVH